MPTPDELDAALDDVALRLGHLCIDAAGLEREIRVLYAYLTDSGRTDRPDDEIRYREGVRRGKHPVSDIIKKTMKIAEERLSSDLAAPIVNALTRSRDLLNERGDIIHSVWHGTVFQDSPEPMKASMREIDKTEQADPKEITRVQFEIRHVKTELTTAFVAAYFALDFDAGAETMPPPRRAPSSTLRADETER